jgi:hypothetical protein
MNPKNTESGIQRWKCVLRNDRAQMADQTRGPYVLHSDHTRIVGELRAEVERLADQRNLAYKAAEQWMDEHDKLKNKYGPLEAVLSEALTPDSAQKVGE